MARPLAIRSARWAAVLTLVCDLFLTIDAAPAGPGVVALCVLFLVLPGLQADAARGDGPLVTAVLAASVPYVVVVAALFAPFLEPALLGTLVEAIVVVAGCGGAVVVGAALLAALLRRPAT